MASDWFDMTSVLAGVWFFLGLIIGTALGVYVSELFAGLQVTGEASVQGLCFTPCGCEWTGRTTARMME